jgi:hypothetical protein
LAETFSHSFGDGSAGEVSCCKPHKARILCYTISLPNFLLSHIEGEPALPEVLSRAGCRFRHSP